DANGQPANSEGIVKFWVVPGKPSTPQSEADVKVWIYNTDIRKKSDLSDYFGRLRTAFRARITDSDNGIAPGGGTDPGTQVDFTFPIDAPCGGTPDPTIGSGCNNLTTLNAIVPGAIKEADRTIYDFGEIQVTDGGADGDTTTAGDNTLFQVEGVFVP